MQFQDPNSDILFENKFDSVACFDMNMRCIFANVRFSEQFGFPLDKLIGNTLKDMGGIGDYQDIWDFH